jgi:hypothetical protein
VALDIALELFSEPIQAALAALQGVAAGAALWRGLASAHMHSTSAGELSLTLCYSRQGEPVMRGRELGRAGPTPPPDAPAWRTQAEALRAAVVAGGACRACHVAGQWRKAGLRVGAGSV